MDVERILAFRLARSGLARRTAGSPAEAARCPASDFSPGAALLALAARAEGVTRAGCDAAVDAGELALAHAPRGAIHALAPEDVARFGRALRGADEAELAAQLGQPVRRQVAATGISAATMLREVADGVRDALAGGAALDRIALHAALRERVRAALLPWCKGCESHHVAPMLWRHATVEAGARLDSRRRYGLEPAPDAALDPSEAVRRFLRCYGPATPGDFAEWAGVGRPQARRLWARVQDELVEAGGGAGALLAEDAPALAAPPAAEGLRLLPPGDPYLMKPNRPLLAPDAALRSRLFRPVASPGAVLVDGRLAGAWRVRARGRRAELAVAALGGRIPTRALEAEAERVARLRGAEAAVVVQD